jgi:proteasome lid subunit RPN8/RPN11
MLRIKGSALQKIIAQAERDYPYETCGLLLGKAEGVDKNCLWSL